MGFRLTFVVCAIFIVLVQFVTSDTVFSNQYLGNYLTDEEYKSREKCNTKVCLFDADRLIYAATRNGSVKPCDDFKTFAMGEFYLHRKLNDRYSNIGFSAEVDHLLQERYRNVLKLPTKKDDLKVHKFLKSYFKKCTDTDHITKHAADEVFAYLNSLGGSPWLEFANGTWDETKFDISTLIDLDLYAFYFLTDRLMTRCEVPSEDPEQDKRDLICLKTRPRDRIGKVELMKILKLLKFDKSKQQKVVEDYEEFTKIMSVNVTSDANNSTKLMPIKDFSAAFPHVKINWLKLCNKILFSASQVTEDEEIYIEYPENLNQNLILLAAMDRGVVANAFTAHFLFFRTPLLFTHFLKTASAERLGTKHSLQRLDVCIELPFKYSLRLALDSLLAQKKFNKETQIAAKELVMEAVADRVSEVKERQTSTVKQELINQELIEKLKNIDLQVMFLDEALNGSIIDKFYDELNFEETMSLLELQLAMEFYFFKVRNELESSWIKALNRTDYIGKIKYFVDENTLVVHALYTLPPYFVVNRPRFFNLATLYTAVTRALLSGLYSYHLKNKRKLEEFPLDFDDFSLADKNYLKWEANGGKELQLSSFKLTNRQMFWLCVANVHAHQFQKKKPRSVNPLQTILSEFYHIFFKKKERFREAFQCGELTQQDKEMSSAHEKALNKHTLEELIRWLQ